MNVSFGNLIRATGEINEAIFPVRQLWRDYETDSGGAGRVPRQLRQPLPQADAGAGDDLHLRRRQEVPDARHRRRQARLAEPAAWCAPAAPHAHEVGDKAGYVQHEAGECYEYHYGGGGGWGDPLDAAGRAGARRRARRVRLGRGARRDYGVVLTGDARGPDAGDRPRRDGAAARRDACRRARGPPLTSLTAEQVASRRR